jgi:hypothetical protein
VLVTGEQPTAAMKATTRGVIADFRRIFPRGTAIRPHSAVRPDGTDCPGPAARAAIARGDFTPTSSEDDMTPAQMQELKNFIEARSQAYALWVHRQLRKDLTAVVQAYTMDIKNYERQTDAADAQRAANAVWASAPDTFQTDTEPKPAADPQPEPDADSKPYLLLPEPDPLPTADTTPDAPPAPEASADPAPADQPESGADPEPNPEPKPE